MKLNNTNLNSLINTTTIALLDVGCTLGVNGFSFTHIKNPAIDQKTVVCNCTTVFCFITVYMAKQKFFVRRVCIKLEERVC